MWKNGSTPIITSSDRIPIAASDCRTFATRFRWVSCTTLANPVVPLDIGIAATDAELSTSTETGAAPVANSDENAEVPSTASPSTKTSSTPAACAAGSARSRNCGIVRRKRARVARSCFSMSSADASELIVVFEPPAMSTPWNATAYSGTLGEKIANTSPGPKPRAARPEASARVIPASCV